jgi:hypothetical protein
VHAGRGRRDSGTFIAGGADAGNIAAACRPCNKFKGSIAPSDREVANAPRAQRLAWAKDVVTERRAKLEQKFVEVRHLFLELAEEPAE